MFDPFTLAMIGAGVGAFTNKKDPLKGALIGGSLGYGGGLLAAPGAAAAGTTAAGTSAATGAGAGLGANAPGAAAFNQSMGLSGLPGMGTIESAGMVFNPATGTYLSPSSYLGASTPFATYTGNEGLLSQIGTGAGSLFDMAKTNIPDYVTPENLIGVSSILSNMNSMPRPVASGGNTITGTPYKFDPFPTGQVYTRKRGNR
jgi:hypothetical protein